MLTNKFKILKTEIPQVLLTSNFLTVEVHNPMRAMKLLSYYLSYNLINHSLYAP